MGLPRAYVEADLKVRLSELQETLQGLKQQEKRIAWQLERTKIEKALVDQSLNERMRDYDSAFLS